MPVRRCSDPSWVQHIWDAVRCIQYQRQQTDLPRLTKYLQKTLEHTDSEIEKYVRQLLQDNLLVSENRTGQKGQKVGVVVECFRIPTADNSTPEDDGHDWYCIECHLAGDVICCSKCHRVFHLECYEKKSSIKIKQNDSNVSVTPTINNENNSETASSAKLTETKEESISSSAEKISPTVCSVCHLQNDSKYINIDKEELNYLLTFTLNRIRIWLPPNITDTMAPRTPQAWSTEQEYQWRANQLLYQTMDFRIMDMKLRTHEYTKLAQFQADAMTIQHNAAIFHGLDSQEMEGSKLMLHDCVYDLTEISQCSDCYRHSNEKSSSNWFCIPCKVPHKLVWAKQQGYPYWPAKVIKEPNNQYDVRFFGAKHLRSLIDSKFVKPIETNLQNLHVKRTSAFNKALQELHLHQDLLANPERVAKLLETAEVIKKKNSAKRSSFPSNKSPKSKKKKLSINEDPHNDVHEFELDSTKSSISNSVELPEPKSGNSSSNVTQEIVKTLDAGSDKECDVVDTPDGEAKTMSPLESQDFVSSSTEHTGTQPTLTAEKIVRKRRRRGSSVTSHSLDRPYSDTIEKLRRVLETIHDREELIKVALDSMQHELDHNQSVHAEHLRIMDEAHKSQVSEIKKKQWCYNCEQEAIYHCCWNTAYCSTNCQQQHWQSEHKKICRRKR